LGNFLSIYPISEFHECVQYIFKKDEIQSLNILTMKIIFSISVNEREFFLNECLRGPMNAHLISKVTSKLEMVIAKVAQLETSIFDKPTKLNIDFLFQDNCNQYTWGHTSVTIYPSGGVSACPPFIEKPLSLIELKELYESSYKDATETRQPIFNNNNEFISDECGNFYEIKKKSSLCTLL